MRYLKILLPAALILALAACGKPPQVEIDAAKAAVAKAAKNEDIVTYAPDSLKRAQDKLTQMQKELEAKHFDKVKTLAMEAAAIADKAAEDAKANKEQVKSDAAALIDAVKKALPGAAKTIASAKKIRGIVVDFKALDADVAAAKADLADAQKEYESGAFMSAKNKAAEIQTKLADDVKLVSDAVQAATKKK
jgi:hypothetical protein